MTEPRYVDCRCGHPKATHQAEHAGMCVIGGCHCVDYRAHTLGPDRPQPPSLRDLIAAGKRSPRRSTVAMAERVETALTGLRAALLDELDHAAQQPRPVRVELLPSGRKKPARDKRCDLCGRGDLANLGAHRLHAHGIRKNPPTEGTPA